MQRLSPRFWSQQFFLCKICGEIFYHLGFGVTATGHFHFQNNETEDMLVYQSNPVGVELFSYVNTFVAFMLHSLRSWTHFPLWFIQQEAALVLVEEKRVYNMQPNYSFLLARKVVHIAWRHVCKVLNAINTDFELQINDLSVTLFNKLPWKVAHISWRHVFKVFKCH